ncbi:MAG: NAD-dependent protein deacylase [Anaerolineaceae bacterium]|nr:NAD-dependent protein deacylase [Anaerolineaceae bacterium]
MENTQLSDWINASPRTVFFGGAGVSTESGIPDFRSENGIFKALEKYGRSPETLLSHTYFSLRPDVFFEYYRENLLVTDAEPNPAHLALAHLEQTEKLSAVITQNIDGLHQKAGSKNVLELHGSIYRNYCMKCGKKFDIERIQESEGIPRCSCGGIIRPDVVLYEENLPEGVFEKAIEEVRNASLLIIGGTSLAVYPAAGLLQYFRGSHLVLINKSETPYDSMADLVIREPIGKVFSELAVSV